MEEKGAGGFADNVAGGVEHPGFGESNLFGEANHVAPKSENVADFGGTEILALHLQRCFGAISSLARRVDGEVHERIENDAVHSRLHDAVGIGGQRCRLPLPGTPALNVSRITSVDDSVGIDRPADRRNDAHPAVAQPPVHVFHGPHGTRSLAAPARRSSYRYSVPSELTIEATGNASVVARLITEAWAAGVDPRSWGHLITRDDISELIDERGASAIVARIGETPVGCVVAVPSADGQTVEVQKLAVLPAFRGQTIADELIAEVDRFAFGLRARGLRLAVSAYQPRLLQMYARRGFVVVPNASYEGASPNGRRPIVMARPVPWPEPGSDRAADRSGDDLFPNPIGEAATDPIGDAVVGGDSIGEAVVRGDAVVGGDSIGEAVRALRSGGLVVLPTETVYGLGANASDPLALRRVFATKGRPVDHPLIVHLADGSQLDDWAIDIPVAARTLAATFWPGPLTLVLRRAPHVPDEVTGGRPTVALRVPNHPVALAVLGLFGGGIAAPSANRFGGVSPTTAEHVRRDLGKFLVDGLDVVLDGGPSGIGVESTIVELVDDEPQLLRPGGLPVEDIEAALGRPVRRTPTGPARAPGMLAAHYAPAATVRVVAVGGLDDAVADAAAPVGAFVPLGVTLPDGVARLPAPELFTAEAVAPLLYRTLRSADELGLATLVIVAPDGDGLGPAVRDRLARAETASLPESP